MAEYFGKEHRNVLRDINALIEAAPACALNFEQAWIDVRMPNGGGRSSKTFDMTKDGFTLLAMGFTGSKALAFKLKYIAQFNAMEEHIQAAPVPALPNFSNPAEAARAWAEAYDRWVRHEVLPAISKTGGYLLNEEARDTAKADDRQAMPLPQGGPVPDQCPSQQPPSAPSFQPERGLPVFDNRKSDHEIHPTNS